MGNFNSTVTNGNGMQQVIKHGVTILATGGQEYRGSNYGYGTDPRIITQQELENLLHNNAGEVKGVRSLAIILCVGPAEKYCSRICCTVGIKNALAFKQLNPEAQVVIFYRDIRTYGFGERLYTKARENGILFVRYEVSSKPEIEINPEDGSLHVHAWDHTLKRPIDLQPDLVALSMPIIPQEDAVETAALFKVPLDMDGFFLEAHIKLRPVDFNTGGIFMAGIAHYPKLLDETLVQAQAAASRAARILSKKTLTGGGQIAVVDESLCTGCLTCVRMCPFGVPVINPNLTGVGNILGAAYIEAAVCQGCGICVSECPARAIQLMHYTDNQMSAKVSALVHDPTGFIPLSEIEKVPI